MGSPSVLDGLRKCIEYLETMPEEEGRRIAEDYRKFSEKYDSEEDSFE